jgi:SAM-dependent methyltransferase
MAHPDPLHLRQTFDAAAERYDRVRPGYPTRVFDDLAVLGGLVAGSRVLEIGCGPGQATVPLAERGYQVVALELGEQMAAVARRRLAAHANVEVVVAAFEDWPLPERPFDAVVSATAFHWIAPDVRVPKAARALRPGGILAIIETRRVPAADDRILAALRSCHERWGSDKPPTFRAADADEPPESLAEVHAAALFDQVVWRGYDWEHEYSTDDFRDLLQTFSNVLVLDPAQQAGLLRCIGDVVDRELGGRISERIANQLLIARRPMFTR